MWVPIKDAPRGVLGHVWCPEFGDRTDVVGTVIDYDAHEDGGVFVASSAKGFLFTHWHPLPAAPQGVAAQVASDKSREDQ